MTAALSWRKCSRSTGGDHQGVSLYFIVVNLRQHLQDLFLLMRNLATGPWYSYSGRNSMYEPKLHRFQIPTDKSSSLAQGIVCYCYILIVILH